MLTLLGRSTIMSEFDQNIEIEIGSERNFGLIFALVFTIIGIYPLLAGGAMRTWALIAATVFLILSLLAPRLLEVPNRLWHKFGLLLGAIVAPIAMGLVYYSTVVPLGLLLRFLGRDLLRQKLDSDDQTYWIEREEPAGSMKNQF